MEERTKFLPKPLSPSPIPHEVVPTFKSQEDIVLENCIEKEYKKIINSSVRSKQDIGWRRFIGLGFAILSGIFTTFISILVDELHHRKYKSQIIVLWGFVFCVTISIPLLLFYLVCSNHRKFVYRSVCPCSPSQKVQRNNWILLIVNGIFYWVSIILKLSTLYYLSLAETNVILFLGPILVIFLAHYCLDNEHCKLLSIFLALLTCVGVAVFGWPQIRQEFDNKFLTGVGLGFGCMLCHTISTIILRKIRPVHFSILCISISICGLALSFISFTITGVLSVPVGFKDLLLAAALGSSVLAALLFLILALKYEQVVWVNIVLCCQIIFMHIFQLVFQHDFDMFRIIGSGILIFCILIVGIRRYIATLPRDHGFRRQCSVFLL